MQAQRRYGFLCGCGLRSRALAAAASLAALLAFNGSHGSSCGGVRSTGERALPSAQRLRRLLGLTDKRTQEAAVPLSCTAGRTFSLRPAATLAILQQLLVILVALVAGFISASGVTAAMLTDRTAKQKLLAWGMCKLSDINIPSQCDVLRGLIVHRPSILPRSIPMPARALPYGESLPDPQSRDRVPPNSRLGSALQNGHLQATFTHVEPLGEGPGTHFRALHRLEGAWYSLKIIAMPGLSPQDDISLRQELREVRSLGALADSRHVLRYVTAWCEEPCCLDTLAGGANLSSEAGHASSLHTVMLIVQTELCDCVTLRTWLDTRCGDGQELHLIEQLIKACREIHRSGLVHGNISADSLVVRDNSVLKVGDFSLARPQEAGAAGQIAACADVRAAAAVCLELLCAYGSRLGLAQSAKRAEQVKSFLLSGEVPQEVVDEFPGHAVLLRRMVNPERPSFVEAHAEFKRLRAALRL